MELYRTINRFSLSILIFVGAILFLPFLGATSLFDWDEINFAECAREMIVLDNYLQVHIDFAPFWEKPPLFLWLQVLSMKCFGINEWAARFPNALLGILHLPLLVYVGEKLANRSVGWIWMGLYCCSFLPFLYFKSGIIDPWFNFFIFLSFIHAYQASKSKSLRTTLISGAFAGLAILTKGPVALLLLGLSALLISIYQRRLVVPLSHFGLWLSIALAVPGFWFGLDYLINGPFFLRSFIEYQIRLFQTEDAGHGGFFGYHIVVLLVGCFPASILAFPRFFTSWTNKGIEMWMRMLALVVVILFSLVQSKIIHYSSLAYYPLCFIAAKELLYRFNRPNRNLRMSSLILWVLISLIWIILIVCIPLFADNLQDVLPMSMDENVKAVLSLKIEWPTWYACIALFLVIPLISYFLTGRLTHLLLTASCYIAFIFSFLVLFVPKIGQYTQEMVVDFYKTHANEEVFIENFGYKSYADLFYTNKKPNDVLPSPLTEVIQQGTDRDLLLVTKAHKVNQLEKLQPKIERLYQKGEFFFYRLPANDSLSREIDHR